MAGDATRAGRHGGWTHVLFYLGLSLLVCHELDAVGRYEWRLLPGLNLLDDDRAGIVFILLHVPVFVALWWLTGHRSDRVRGRSQLAVDTFLVLHAMAHFAFSGHADYAFEGPVELITVYGGALVGVFHATLLLRARRQTADGS